VIVAGAPGASVGSVQVRVAKVHVQPAGPISDVAVVFAGSVSITVTPVAVLDPPLVTTCEYVMVPPAVTGIGVAVFVIDTSAEVATSVLTDAALLPPFESPVVELTVAVSVSTVPDAVVAGTLTTNVKGPTVVLAGRFDPSVQVRVPRLQAHPAGPVRLVAVVPVGRVSTIFGVVAAVGPELVTVCV